MNKKQQEKLDYLFSKFQELNNWRGKDKCSMTTEEVKTEFPRKAGTHIVQFSCDPKDPWDNGNYYTFMMSPSGAIYTHYTDKNGNIGRQYHQSLYSIK